jgi:hypothetical protein
VRLHSPLCPIQRYCSDSAVEALHSFSSAFW